MQVLTPTEYELFFAVVDAVVEDRVLSGQGLYRLVVRNINDYDGFILDVKDTLQENFTSYHEWPRLTREALHKYWINRGWSRDHFVEACCLNTDEEEGVVD